MVKETPYSYQFHKDPPTGSKTNGGGKGGRQRQRNDDIMSIFAYK